MQTITLSAHFDGQQIQLDEPFELEPGSQLWITVVPAQTAEHWDAQINDDIAAGKLDALADEALQEVRAGRTTARR
ncbi:hypothetical protein [Hymenobacter actinosclerus]|uniref:Uncharacterized protein n=1 Tax=Hymenobacter actinosclerus TaxID=82805 RepID=A0A1I0EGU8_9BACT|nr:hypothetical protein [Hymenobacter actinosclerus]SET44527.1 hypothetical protein SAMN04487998_1843 [Hymenobacter actinosclerus]